MQRSLIFKTISILLLITILEVAAVVGVMIYRTGGVAAVNMEQLMTAGMAGAVVLGLNILFLIVLFFVLIVPLRKLIGVARNLVKAETITRVPIIGDDEVGQLASSFNELGIMLQHARDELRGANPMSGLPGGGTIIRYVEECLTGGHVIAVLSCDIDNFKAYNDKYGFAKGDEVILYARDCLVAVAQRKDMQGSFVGHFGGDDFMVVCPYDYWENFAKAFVTTFDRGIYQFYNSTDARNGFIESVNRQGQRQKFSLMSISIAVVSNKTRPFRRYAEVMQVAAEVMKYVKTIEGSGYAIDRRSGTVGGPRPAQPPSTPGIPAQQAGG
jgi:diguanylate cyclase (GGDEF)-like protein